MLTVHSDSLPMCWWLPAMTYPTGFLTAVLQVSARMNGLSIDSLSYETPVQISGCVRSILYQLNNHAHENKIITGTSFPYRAIRRTGSMCRAFISKGPLGTSRVAIWKRAGPWSSSPTCRSSTSSLLRASADRAKASTLVRCICIP